MPKSIMIIGCGFVGHQLVDDLVNKGYSPKDIHLVDEYEHQIDIEREKYPDINFLLEDITKTDRIIDYLKYNKSIDTIIYTAAVKHINLAQSNIPRTLDVNTIAYDNLLRGIIDLTSGENCLHNTGVQRSYTVVYLSTDKAPNPVSVYGNSKLLSEFIGQHYASIVDESKLKVYTLRYGNVLLAAGSVIKKFIQDIENSRPIKITNLDMLRYMLPDRLAISMIEELIGIKTDGNYLYSNLRSGDVVVPSMVPTAKIGTLACAINKHFKGRFCMPEVENIGVRPGERLSEVMITKAEEQRIKKFISLDIAYLNKVKEDDDHYMFNLWRIPKTNEISVVPEVDELYAEGLLEGGVGLEMNTEQLYEWLYKWGIFDG